MLTCVPPVLQLRVPSREASCTRTLIFTAEKSETIPATTCHLLLRRTFWLAARNGTTFTVHPAIRVWAMATARSCNADFAVLRPSTLIGYEGRLSAIFLRDDQRLRCYAGLRFANCAARSPVHCGFHPF